jgi:hypothetical protein
MTGGGTIPEEMGEAVHNRVCSLAWEVSAAINQTGFQGWSLNADEGEVRKV